MVKTDTQKNLKRIFMKRHKISYSQLYGWYIHSIPAGNLELPGHADTWYLYKNGKLYHNNRIPNGYWAIETSAKLFLKNWIKYNE